MDPDAPRERRRFVMTLCIADFAIEWVRPLPPNFKMIGAILPAPARPLPADLEVLAKSQTPSHDSSSLPGRAHDEISDCAQFCPAAAQQCSAGVPDFWACACDSWRL